MVTIGAAVFLIAAASVVEVTQGVVWTVDDSNVSLTYALEMLESHSVIYLESGEHRIERFRLIENLTNITIKGRGNNVKVTCV